MKYEDVVTIAPRFERSVNLERDALRPTAVDGYILTVTAEQLLARIARAIASPVGQRAWNVTGPYGSGKSAFALYAVQLLGSSRSPASASARSILREKNQELFRQLFDQRKLTTVAPEGFCPILVTGTAGPLLPALVTACARDLERFCGHRIPAAVRRVLQLQVRLADGETIPAADVVESLVAVATAFQKSGRAQGLLLVVDELGKFLEYAARDPERGDIYVLQLLAEATAAFHKPGLFVLTILHQSFERYAAGLRPALRDEWSKVQGRFEEVAFQQPPEELITLLAHAIRHAKSGLTSALESRARDTAKHAYALGLAPRSFTKRQFVHAMQRCAPLHPTSVLTLVRLCRKFGQNQRSLFAFLVSREPHGFAEFLAGDVEPKTLPFYRLDRLYDYVVQALGDGLSVGESAARWAEINSALERGSDATDQERALVKTVGVLSAAGAQGELKPSREVIDFALDGTPAERAVRGLLARSIVIYRRHSGSFALWQGSDIDLDERIAEAKRHVPETLSLARKLSALWAPRPLVAKRHSFETGTLRYFAIRFADSADFPKALERGGDADGLLVYCVPQSEAEIEQLAELAASAREREDVLIAVPKQVDALRQAARELELLRWVEGNTPELEGDAVARRELRSRLVFVNERLEAEIRSLFAPGNVGGQTHWFHRGLRRNVTSGRSLAQLLSDICDAVYRHTPRLRNELLNRRELSSAAAAARRNLIEAMISRGSEEHLGIAGNPPEMSMYLSVLRSTGIHRLDGEAWTFGPPAADQDLLAVWREIETFFSGSELQRRSVAELFERLQLPPYGLKMGIIPVLFCAVALAYDTELAFYENGAFVPELTVEMFERLLRSASTFEVRRYRISGVRREVYREFAAVLGAGDGAPGNLLAVLKPLYRFFNGLPQYTRQTKTLSPQAMAVREALIIAKDPDVLLFDALPRACGVEPFLPTASRTKAVAAFFATLKAAFSELQRAYGDLLTDLQQVLLRAFAVSGSKGREAIRFRAQVLEEHAADPRLRIFIQHLCEEQLEDAAWVEAIAALLVGRPARSWNDGERVRYEVALGDFCRSFRHLDALVFEQTQRTKAGEALGEAFRIGVTDRYSKDREAVVVVEEHDRGPVMDAAICLEEQLDKLQLSQKPDLALAALAFVCRRFLAELDDTGKEKARQKIVGITNG